jgi:hypothetical protein
MPERREDALPRDNIHRQIMRPHVQHFRPERRAMGGRFDAHGGRHRL